MYKKLILIFLITVSSSCSYLQPSPIPNTKFLSDVPGELDDKNERAPFQRSWADKKIIATLVGIPGVKIKSITVNTDFIKTSDRKRLRSFQNIKKDAKDLATLFEEKTIEALKNFPEKTADYNENALTNDKTLELQLAIVELAPQAVIRKALSSGFGLFTHIGSIFGIYGDSVIAVEGKLIRTSDRKVIAAFADRHSGKISPVDFRIFSRYHQSKENIREWSNDIAELLNTPLTHKVKGESVITLLPW